MMNGTYKFLISVGFFVAVILTIGTPLNQIVALLNAVWLGYLIRDIQIIKAKLKELEVERKRLEEEWKKYEKELEYRKNYFYEED